MPDDDRPFNRRNFFREGLRHLLKPMQNAAAPLEEMIKQLSALDLENEAVAKHQASKAALPAPTVPVATLSGSPSPISIMMGTPIRPPGALAEQQFRETCSRCGECVKVCPVQCIKIDSSGLRGAGAPFIDIDSAACVLCDGLLCMNKCPSGALVPIPMADIDMGTAHWHADKCLRTTGEQCTVCIDTCPIGEMAILLEGGSVKVIEDGCTGCGVCQKSLSDDSQEYYGDTACDRGGGPQLRGRTR